MENIKQALDRARSIGRKGKSSATQAGANLPPVQVELPSGILGSPNERPPARSSVVPLDPLHLETRRIIAHDDTDYRARSFDMLRTQVLQAMDQKNWRILGITSPSPGCGKTLTAINLALSIARQSERAALLVDLDLQKPQVAASLGIHRESGVLSVLQNQTSLSDAIVHTEVAGTQLAVLAAESPTSNSSTWMTSRAMAALLQELRTNYRDHSVILDLPPMLAADDVIALMPQLDCALLVAAIGTTTAAEVAECNGHLQGAQVLRIVLNKVPRLNTRYYY